MKKRGNKNMLPQITVFQKQQTLFVLIIVPVIFILRDLYFASSSPLISLALRLSEKEFPLKLQISGFVLEAQGPQFKKAVCIQAMRPVQYGSASEDIMIKQQTVDTNSAQKCYKSKGNKCCLITG